MLTRRGFTLMELMVASTIAIVVAAGIITMDAGRARMEVELVDRSQQDTEEQQVGLASLLLARDFQQADRVNILNTGQPGTPPYTGPAGFGNVQIRIPVGCMGAPPPPACFDAAGNYQWIQYRRVGNELWRYDNTGAGCGGVEVVARELGATPQNRGFEVSYQDATIDPPWAVGGPDDTNVLEHHVTWNNGLTGSKAKEHTFSESSTMRAFGYMDVNRGVAGAGDSGTGLAPDNTVAPPPAGC